MEIVIALCGAVGGWLLVAGPLYQAALELREQEIDRDGIQASTSTVPKPPRISPWWWLIPPVAYVKQQRRSQKYRDAVAEAMTQPQLEQWVSFVNKANAWLLVAIGAFLIAVKETWETVELLHWWTAVFWVLIVLVPVLCFGNAAVRINRSDRMIAHEWSDRRPSASR